MTKRDYLKKFREVKKLTQEEVAEKLGLATNSYCLIENNQRRSDLPISYLKKFAEIFEVSEEEILKHETN
jgi:transcriptional regulator with XRE-family HTH domain